MRNILVVFSDIYKLVPEEEKEFKKSMENLSDTLTHSPPERIKNDPELWHKFNNIINFNIKQDDYHSKEWCKKIIDIYTDPNYKIDIIST